MPAEPRRGANAREDGPGRDAGAVRRSSENPRIVGEVGESQVKIAKVRGAFVWHDHRDEDELSLVLSGRLVIELRDGEVVLGPGEFVVMPNAGDHGPVADEEVQVMLVEPASSRRSGDVVDERTVAEFERL